MSGDARRAPATSAVIPSRNAVSTDIKPRRRWFQFKLRTLFVAMTVLRIALGWVAYSLSWIRERHQFLSTRRQYFDESLLEQMEAQSIFNGMSHRPVKPTVAAPRGLWLFGEQGAARVIVITPNDLEAARRLFPEAKIVQP
jgi:hypothetical protein